MVLNPLPFQPVQGAVQGALVQSIDVPQMNRSHVRRRPIGVLKPKRIVLIDAQRSVQFAGSARESTKGCYSTV